MLTVADIMTTNVWTIRSSAKVVQAIALMQAKQTRSLIVEREVEGGAYGIITTQDIVYGTTAKCADPTTIMVGEIMKMPCVVIDMDLSLPDLAQRFLASNIIRAPVVKEGQLLGVVSITDIVMKSNVEAIHLPEHFSEKLELAICQHRLGWTLDEQLDPICESAISLLDELR